MARPGRPRNDALIADGIRQAINYATTSEASALLENTNIDVLDGESRTPFIHAAIAGNVELLSWLIGRGANINHQDRNGWSALHYAVQQKHVDAVKWLLTNGAAIEPKDVYGNTPLWRAAFDSRGTYELVRLLAAHGADPNSKNKSDRSPVDFATQIGDQQLVAALRNG